MPLRQALEEIPRPATICAGFAFEQESKMAKGKMKQPKEKKKPKADKDKPKNLSAYQLSKQSGSEKK